MYKYDPASSSRVEIESLGIANNYEAFEVLRARNEASTDSATHTAVCIEVELTRAELQVVHGVLEVPLQEP